MKKNLILTAALTALLTFTYFFQELGSKKKRQLLEIKNKIIKVPFNEVDWAQLKNTKLIQTNGRWMVGDLDFPASESKVQALFNHLASIHQIKELPLDNVEQYFSVNDYEVVIGSMGKSWKYRLGDVSELTGNFYFQDMNTSPNRVYLAIDTSEFSGLYKTELELYLNKYLNFKDQILASPYYFVNKDLLRGIEVSDIAKFKIDNKWNRWFEVNLKDQTTTPAPFKKMVPVNLSQIMNEDLEKLKIKELKPRDKSMLKSQICKVNFELNSGEVIELLVFAQEGDEAGMFVTTSVDPKWVFKLDIKARDFLFGNIQKYWNKKLFTEKDLEHLDSLELLIGQKDKRYRFKVDDVANFELKAISEEVTSINKSNTNLLFHILFSLTQFNQASVAYDELIKIDENLLTISVWILEKDLEIVFTPTRVFILNKTDKITLEYLFPAGDYNLDSLNDFFALKD